MKYESMRHALPVTGCVVALVVLAGCGGILGSETTTPVTSTPAPVPTDGPLADPPTGLNESGITDPLELASTHQRALDNTSYTYQRTSTLTAVNGTELVNASVVARFPANESRSLTVQTYATPQPVFGGEVEQVTQWYNGSATLLRITAPNETRYTVFDESTVASLRLSDVLEGYYVNPDSVAVTSNASSIEIRLTSTSGDEMPPRTPVNVTNRTVTVTMTESGLVEQYRVEYTGTLVNDPETTVEGVQAVRVTAVGETTVERPDWVSSARNTTATSNW
jgi:hypothetical protein